MVLSAASRSCWLAVADIKCGCWRDEEPGSTMILMMRRDVINVKRQRSGMRRSISCERLCAGDRAYGRSFTGLAGWIVGVACVGSICIGGGIYAGTVWADGVAAEAGGCIGERGG